MTTIDQLPVDDSIDSADQIPIWSNADGVARRASVSLFDARYQLPDDVRAGLYKFIGISATPPTTRSNGDGLQLGDVYTDTQSFPVTWIYTSQGWEEMYGADILSRASGYATAAQASATEAGQDASAAATSATNAAASASQAATTLANALVKTNNLSDVANVATARANLVAAKSGANSDITSITGLTTALSAAQGGTGGNISLATGAALVGFKNPSLPNAVTTNLLNKSQVFIDLKADYGAACDGVTDDTSKVQNALNDMTGGGRLLIRGTCLVSAALTIAYDGIRIVGSGIISSGFYMTSATADLFVTTTALRSVEFHNFNVWSSVTKTAGSVFNLVNPARFVFNRIFAGDRTTVAAQGSRLYNVLYMAGCDDCLVTGCTFAGFSNYAVAVYGSATAQSELRLTGGTRISVGNIGVLVGGNFGGMYLGEVSVDSCVKDVVISQALSATINREIFLGDMCVLDACSDTCLEVQANGCAILQLTGAWLASAGKYGTASGNQTCCNILPTNPALRFIASGAHFYNAANTGLAINGCATANISGCQFDYNTTYGINLANSAVTSAAISGGRAFNNGIGINIATGVPAFSVIGMDLTGNSTATAISPALAYNRFIQGCYGYTSYNSGQATLSTSSASTTVTHGLSGTPSINDITLTLLTGTNATWFAITAVTATTFTITASAAATSTVTMAWRAQLPRV